LYTSYSFFDGNKKISWAVCGSLPGSSGCYGNGDLGPFGNVGAMLEDNPSTNLAIQTVTRFIYVLDIGRRKTSAVDAPISLPRGRGNLRSRAQALGAIVGARDVRRRDANGQ